MSHDGKEHSLKEIAAKMEEEQKRKDIEEAEIARIKTAILYSPRGLRLWARKPYLFFRVKI